MQIAWLGHHCYRITSDSGLKIITDPYPSPLILERLGELKYAPLEESADIVTVTHEHIDHNNAKVIRGNPEVFKGSEFRGKSKRIKGIEFKAIPCFHDTTAGKDHGENNIIVFELDGMKVCHDGDLGHELNPKQIAEIGKVDVLLLAVAYAFEVNTQWADILLKQLKPRVTIPGHFGGNDKCTFKIPTIDEFLKGKENISRLDERGISEIEIKKGKLPKSPEIIVLKSVY